MVILDSHMIRLHSY